MFIFVPCPKLQKSRLRSGLGHELMSVHLEKSYASKDTKLPIGTQELDGTPAVTYLFRRVRPYILKHSIVGSHIRV